MEAACVLRSCIYNWQRVKTFAVNGYLITHKLLDSGSTCEILHRGHRTQTFRAVHMVSQQKVRMIAYDADVVSNEVVTHLIDTHQRLVHPHLVRLYQVIHHDSMIWFVFDLPDTMPMTQLDGLLSRRLGSCEKAARVIIRQVVAGLLYLHSNGYVFGHIADEDIFMTKEAVVKLGGLEKCRLVRSSNSSKKKQDIREIGLVTLALVTGVRQQTDIGSELVAPCDILNGLSRDCADFLSRILTPRNGEVMSYPELIYHPWLNRGTHASQAHYVEQCCSKMLTLSSTVIKCMATRQGFNRDCITVSVIGKRVDEVAATYHLLHSRLRKGLALSHRDLAPDQTIACRMRTSDTKTVSDYTPLAGEQSVKHCQPQGDCCVTSTTVTSTGHMRLPKLTLSKQLVFDIEHRNHGCYRAAVTDSSAFISHKRSGEKNQSSTKGSVELIAGITRQDEPQIDRSQQVLLQCVTPSIPVPPPNSAYHSTRLPRFPDSEQRHRTTPQSHLQHSDREPGTWNSKPASQQGKQSHHLEPKPALRGLRANAALRMRKVRHANQRKRTHAGGLSHSLRLGTYPRHMAAKSHYSSYSS